MRQSHEFHGLLRIDKSHWLGCCFLWHGWLPLLSLGVHGASLWAGSASEGAGTLLECSVGSFSSRLLLGCDVLDEFDRDSIAQRMPASPNVWTDGSLVPD